MTATDDMRRLLDERGVEYTDRDMFSKHVFHWGEPLHGAMFTDGGEWTELVVENATPEQAVAATLEPKTCKMVYNFLANVSRCVSCGERVTGRPSNFCPRCGRRIVEVDE